MKVGKDAEEEDVTDTFQSSNGYDVDNHRPNL